jgi:hypothetical protein
LQSFHDVNTRTQDGFGTPNCEFIFVDPGTFCFVATLPVLWNGPAGVQDGMAFFVPEWMPQ